MNKFFSSFSLCIALFLFGIVLPTSAATLDFNPDSVSTSQDGTFSVDLTIDAGTEQVAGTDIYVSYNPSYLELQSVTARSFFPKIDNIPSSGKLYIAGVIENQGDYKTGQGTVAVISFKSLKSGSTTVSYTCDIANTETSKIVKNDINATNLINCSGNGSLIVSSDSTATDDSNSDTSSPNNSNTLPQSGVYENVMQYSLAGIVLLFIGFGLRILVR